MKLHELGAQRPTEQATKVLENQIGKRFDFNRLGYKQARGMLGEVRSLINEFRNKPDFHVSQKNSAYLQLMIMEQALNARVQEQQAMAGSTPVASGTAAAAATNDPKARAVMDKVKRNQPLTPDEQLTVNKIALTKEGKKKPARMVREQSELQQAQVVLAAQDMVDRLQGVLEDISEMQFKDLPALADSIKNDIGVDQATQFQSSASTALTQLIAAVQAGKTELQNAQGILTGQAPQVPGADDMGAMPPAAAADELAGEVDDLDAAAADAADDIEDAADDDMLGRERR